MSVQQRSGGDGSVTTWQRTFGERPAFQMWPGCGGGRVRVGERSGRGFARYWTDGRVDWVEREPLPFGWGWLAVGALVGVALGAVSRSKLSGGDS